MLYIVVVLLTIRQYAFVVRLDIYHFRSSSFSTNILGIGIKYKTIKIISYIYWIVNNTMQAVGRLILILISGTKVDKYKGIRQEVLWIDV